MRSAGTGGDYGVVRAFEAVADGNLTRRKVDKAGWNKERRHTARTFFGQRHGRSVYFRQSANARTDQNAGSFAVIVIGRNPAAVFYRFIGCAYRKVDEIIHLALVFRRDDGVDIEQAGRCFRRTFFRARNLSSHTAGKVTCIEASDSGNTGLPSGKTTPIMRHPNPKRSHQP